MRVVRSRAGWQLAGKAGAAPSSGMRRSRSSAREPGAAAGQPPAPRPPHPPPPAPCSQTGEQVSVLQKWGERDSATGHTSAVNQVRISSVAAAAVGAAGAAGPARPARSLALGPRPALADAHLL